MSSGASPRSPRGKSSTKDGAWVKTQKKTFTKWVNAQLKRRYGADALVVKSLSRAFRDGIVLIDLVHALHPKVSKPHYNKHPKITAHYYDNVSLAIDMASRAGIALPDTGPEQLVDCDTKMIMGMIWRIINSHQISAVNVGKLRGREGLLLWCQRRTKGYAGVEVTDFASSWTSGLAFLALLHSARPELVGDWSAIKPEEHAENLKRAFDLAEEGLEIAPLLDVEDLLNVKQPDERSIITYVSEFFSVIAANSETERAARVLRSAAMQLIEAEQGESEYNRRANELAEWAQRKTEEFESVETPEDTGAIEAELRRLHQYYCGEKVERGAELSALLELHAKIRLQKLTKGEVAFDPTDNAKPKALVKIMTNLGRAESALEERLLDTQNALDDANAEAAGNSAEADMSAVPDISNALDDLLDDIEEVNAKKAVSDVEKENLETAFKSLNELMSEKHVGVSGSRAAALRTHIAKLKAKIPPLAAAEEKVAKKEEIPEELMDLLDEYEDSAGAFFDRLQRLRSGVEDAIAPLTTAKELLAATAAADEDAEVDVNEEQVEAEREEELKRLNAIIAELQKIESNETGEGGERSLKMAMSDVTALLEDMEDIDETDEGLYGKEMDRIRWKYESYVKFRESVIEAAFKRKEEMLGIRVAAGKQHNKKTHLEGAAPRGASVSAAATAEARRVAEAASAEQFQEKYAAESLWLCDAWQRLLELPLAREAALNAAEDAAIVNESKGGEPLDDEVDEEAAARALRKIRTQLNKLKREYAAHEKALDELKDLAHSGEVFPSHVDAAKSLADSLVARGAALKETVTEKLAELDVAADVVACANTLDRVRHRLVTWVKDAWLRVAKCTALSTADLDAELDTLEAEAGAQDPHVERLRELEGRLVTLYAQPHALDTARAALNSLRETRNYISSRRAALAAHRAALKAAAISSVPGEFVTPESHDKLRATFDEMCNEDDLLKDIAVSECLSRAGASGTPSKKRIEALVKDFGELRDGKYVLSVEAFLRVALQYDAECVAERDAVAAFKTFADGDDALVRKEQLLEAGLNEDEISFLMHGKEELNFKDYTRELFTES